MIQRRPCAVSYSSTHVTHTSRLCSGMLIVHSAEMYVISYALAMQGWHIPLHPAMLKSSLFPLPIPPLLFQYLLAGSSSAEGVTLGLRRQRCCEFLGSSHHCLFRFLRCSRWRQLFGGRCACCQVQTAPLCRSCCTSVSCWR